MSNKIALLVIDLQKDFCLPGSAYSDLGYPISQNILIADKILGIIHELKKRGVIIYYVLSHYDGFTIKGKKCTFCLKKQSGSESFLPTPEADRVVYKISHDGFYRTKLHKNLQADHVKELLVCGISTSVCVDSTARSAVARGYKTTIISDCVQSRDKFLHDSALRNFKENFGYVNNSKSIIKGINGCKVAESRAGY